ncbi:response regulator [Thiohalophilus sp.]|uniref:response regulator n=1 Tax=Thiohalophilus sp. TaxID=3028392 RepID=UPI003975E228
MNDTVTVLYVEDEDDIREMTEFALEDEGFELIQCVSGQDALEKAAGVHPDLILLDVMMPGMDGVSTAQKLREMPHLADVPVIFMTAKVQQTEVEKYKAMGAIGVIKKPFDAMELPDQIRELLESAND